MKERFLIFQEVPPPPASRPGGSPEAQNPVTDGVKVKAEGQRKDQQAKTADKVIQPKEAFTDIPEVSPENLTEARAKLKEALNWIKLKLAGKKLSIKLNIDYSDPEKYLPLMIKESKLFKTALSPTGAVGYFQLKQGAIDDVNRIFYPQKGAKIFDLEATLEGVKTPLNNCIVGILFYHMCVDQYAGKSPFNGLPASEKKIIGHMIYNKGFSGIKKLWELSGQKTFTSFEKKIADELAQQLGTTAGSQVTVRDKYMNVDYKEYPVIVKYIELWGKEKTDPSAAQLLSQPFKINGKDSGLTIKQAGEVLRYGRIIEGIASSKENGANNHYEIDEIKKDHGLWFMANKLMKECQEEGMEGFEDLQTHIERRNMREILMDAIVDFNIANNPEFKDVPDDITGYIFKDGTKVFIPNKEYIKFVTEGLGDKAKEEAVKAEKEYQKPETKEALKTIPVYTDPTLGKAGTATLKNKKYVPIENPKAAPKALEEKDIPTYVNAEGKKELAQSRWYWKRGKKTPRIDDPVLRKETKYIILHSTISPNGDDAKRSKKAHYVVEKDGSITYVLDRKYYLNHAGKTEDTNAQAKWAGDDEISKKSIGIEVVAQKGEEWNTKQYDAIKRLVHLMGSIYGIEAKNVLTHSQVAMATYTGGKCRGRKSDPININWALLDLPDNSKLVDKDVALGLISPNFSSIAEQSKTKKGDWYGYREDKLVGLKAAAKIAEDAGRAFWKGSGVKKAPKARDRHPFRMCKVKKGDMLGKLAQKYHTTVAQIKKDNSSIKRDTIYPGMTLKIRK